MSPFRRGGQRGQKEGSTDATGRETLNGELTSGAAHTHCDFPLQKLAKKTASSGKMSINKTLKIKKKNKQPESLLRDFCFQVSFLFLTPPGPYYLEKRRGR